MTLTLLDHANNLAQTLSLLVYLVTITAWVAGISFVRFQRQTKDKQRYRFFAYWLLLNLCWWTTSSYLRLFTTYNSPTALMSLLKSIVDLQTFISCIFLFYQLRRVRQH